MNKRIQELAEQAELEVNAVFVWWPEGPEREDVVKEKFAELIVRECAHIAWLYDDPKLYWHGAVIAKSIKHRFGVE